MNCSFLDVDYDLVIFTGMEAGAGTDAKEFKVNLMGEMGESGDVTFEREGESLSRGCEDTYPLTCKELGQLKKLKISHDGKGFKSAWFLEKVGSCSLLKFSYFWGYFYDFKVFTG